MTLFGGGAAGGLRILPKTWGFVARNCGRCLVERREDGATVSYVDLPEVMRTEWFAAAGEGAYLNGRRLKVAAAPPSADLSAYTVLTDLGYERGSLPVSEHAAEHTVAIPIYPELTREQQDAVVDCVLQFYG